MNVVKSLWSQLLCPLSIEQSRMSSIITSILSSTVSLLWNKARNAAAEKLKDGDITEAKIREIVVRELNDTKTKLGALLRKDLLSSYRFLNEGVELLNVSGC